MLVIFKDDEMFYFFFFMKNEVDRIYSLKVNMEIILKIENFYYYFLLYFIFLV